MPKAELNYRSYDFPEHHEGDREWLAAMLYGVESRRHPAGPQIGQAQRDNAIARYTNTYCRMIELNTDAMGREHFNAPNMARRAANNELRLTIEGIQRQQRGDTVHLRTI